MITKIFVEIYDKKYSARIKEKLLDVGNCCVKIKFWLKIAIFPTSSPKAFWCENICSFLTRISAYFDDLIKNWISIIATVQMQIQAFSSANSISKPHIHNVLMNLSIRMFFVTLQIVWFPSTIFICTQEFIIENANTHRRGIYCTCFKWIPQRTKINFTPYMLAWMLIKYFKLNDKLFACM